MFPDIHPPFSVLHNLLYFAASIRFLLSIEAPVTALRNREISASSHVVYFIPPQVITETSSP